MSVEIKIGQKYNSLLVVKQLDKDDPRKNSRRGRCFECLCDCGATTLADPWSLFYSHKKSCGCLRYDRGYDDSFIGKKFHKLTITSFSHKSRFRCIYFNYLCECGKTGVIRTASIGKHLSCGCSYKKKIGGITQKFFHAIEKSAEKRKLEFSITKQYIWDLFLKQNQKCALSGVPLKFNSSWLVIDGNASLDRIDSNKGYTEDNVQWVHKDINVMKMNSTDKEFYDWCVKVVRHNKGRF